MFERNVRFVNSIQKCFNMNRTLQPDYRKTNLLVPRILKGIILSREQKK